MQFAAFVDGSPTSTAGAPRELRDPATGEVRARFEDATTQTLDLAVAAADRARRGDWCETTPGERSAVLFALAGLLEQHSDELVDAEVADTGKPVHTFADGELPFALDNLRFFAGAARSVAGTGTGRFTKGLRVAHQLEAGVTWINDHLPIASEAPHGGMKLSGFGSDLSEESVLAYSVPRHVMIRHAVTEAHEGFRPA